MKEQQQKYIDELNDDIFTLASHGVATVKLLQAAQAYAKLYPVLCKFLEDCEDLLDKADYKHGDDLKKLLESELLLLQFGEASADMRGKIREVLE